MSDQLRELYQEVIIDHARNPRNFGSLEQLTHHAEGFNPLCGDKLSLELAIENNKISHVKFTGEGCAISTASASLMTQSLKDKTEIDKIDLENKIIEALKTVYDPEIPVNIYDLGLIYKIDINDDAFVKVDMTLTAPGCPVAQTFPGVIENTVASVTGVTSATVELVWEPAWTTERMSEAAKLELGMF